MKFKRGNHSNQLPEMNLVPMLDVLMTVLTFFIIVSMSLAIDKSVEVPLPNSQASPSPSQKEPEPLVIALDKQGIKIKDQSVPQPQLLPQIKAYLAQNPKGIAVLQADPKVPYEQVIQLLGEMKSVGGDRVSLAIE
jgi:biopolymer transport protein ExbD